MRNVYSQAKSRQAYRWLLVLPAATAALFLTNYGIEALYQWLNIFPFGSYRPLTNAIELFTPFAVAVLVAPSRRYLAPISCLVLMVVASYFTSPYQGNIWQLTTFILHDTWSCLIVSMALGVLLEVRAKRKKNLPTMQPNPAI